MNPFNTFSLQPVLDIDLEALRQLYQDLAAKNHPDSGGDKANFEKINQDYQALLSPAKRIKAFLAATNVEYDPRGAVSNDLMDLFMQVGALVQEADAFIRKKSAATSVLAKALLEGDSMDLQEKLSELIAVIETQQETITSQFKSNLHSDTLPQLARNLAFLEKWQAQLQQRYGALF